MTKYRVYLGSFEIRARITETWDTARMLKEANGYDGKSLGVAEDIPVARYVFEKGKRLCRSFYFWTPAGRYLHFDHLYMIADEYDEDGELVKYGEIIAEYVAEIDERG